MARYKDSNWDCDTCTNGSGKAETAVLMDIRDELKRLNALLHCSNFVQIPRKLDAIRRNTTKKRRQRP